MKTDTPHILCVNPWIHDFAAFDFWAKPYGLLSITAILRQQGCKVSFIDCLDRFHPNETHAVKIQWDGRGPYRKTRIKLPSGLEHEKRNYCRYGIKPEWFVRDLETMEKPDLILVTSLMTYWADGVKETISYIKKVFQDVPVVLGGIYASLCRGHALENSGADLVANGPAEGELGRIIRQFTGFDIDIPGPLNDLDQYPYPAFDLLSKHPYVPLLTSRGCPYNCEYCASSFLEPAARRRSAQNVFDEIKYWYKKYGVINFPFYDDALLVNSSRYAFVLFEKIITSGLDLQFHTPNALHVKAVTKKAADLMFRAGFKTIRLGLETTHFGENRHHDKKVGHNDFAKAVENLKSAGFEKKQLGAYLLCGLPGQNLDDVAQSIEIVSRTGILPVLAFYTPIPHTPMWADAVAAARYDLEKHPVFTNNTLFPCVPSDPDLIRISQLKNSTR